MNLTSSYIFTLYFILLGFLGVYVFLWKENKRYPHSVHLRVYTYTRICVYGCCIFYECIYVEFFVHSVRSACILYLAAAYYVSYITFPQNRRSIPSYVMAYPTTT